MKVENLSHNAVNEAYTLLMAYLREEKIGAKYDKAYLEEFIHFLHDILKHPDNFVKVHVEEEEEVANT